MIIRKPPSGLFARLLDSLPDIYTLVLDQDHRVTYANLSFLQHFNRQWPEIAGHSCDALGLVFTGTDGSKLGVCPSELVPVYPGRSLFTREEGDKKFIYEANLFYLPGDGGISFNMWSFRDITDRFRLESQVRQMDELERNLVQAAMDGIIVNDMLGNVVIFNRGASKILGYSPEEVIGKIKVNRFYPEKMAHEIKQLIYDAAYGGFGSLENFETVTVHKDGSLIPIWLSARLLHQESEEVGIVGYFRDLRERKRLESEILRKERLATLGNMVAHISHEIKNPLMTVGGFASQLSRKDDLPPEARRKLEVIHHEVQRLEKFLADLRNFTHATPPQKTMGDLSAVVQEVADFLGEVFQAQGVNFRFVPSPELPRVAFDSDQIRQVLLNLFKNALEAMPEGGKLTVTAEMAESHLILKIADTGHGIPPDDLKSLFTPFFTTKEGGTGLGLTICRGLITQHDGEMSIDSEVAVGTTCTIRLPLGSS